MDSCLTSLNSLNLSTSQTANFDTETEPQLDANTFITGKNSTRAKHKNNRVKNQVHEALINHKNVIEEYDKKIHHLYSTQMTTADILREHSETHKKMQYRIEILEALLLQLCAQMTRTRTCLPRNGRRWKRQTDGQ